jgi:hypothetical protein
MTKDWSPHLLQALTTLDAGRWRRSTLVHFAPTSVVPTAPTWVVCFAATAVLKHHLIPHDNFAATAVMRFAPTGRPLRSTWVVRFAGHNLCPT